jgi:alpha-1,2-rhamnosyltransferase
MILGTIEPRKNHQFLLDWFENFSSDENLLLVGRLGWKSGSTLRIIRRLRKNADLSQRFRWEQHLSDGDLLKEFSQADIGICPSYEEGFGLPLIEFLKRGIIVLASDCPAHLEIESRNVLFYRQNSSSDFTDKLLLAKNTQFVEEDLSKYTWKNTCLKLSTILKDFDEN